MTDAQRRNAIESLIQRHTDLSTATRQQARATLISEGIYTKKGTLRVEYGGESKKNKNAA